MEGQRILMASYWLLVTKAMYPIGLRYDIDMMIHELHAFYP
jgi:hypothetical protein